MKKRLGVAVVLVISGAIVATAAASLRTYTAGTKYVKGVGTVGCCHFKATIRSGFRDARVTVQATVRS